MKTVSSMLYSYFIMRGLHEKDKTGSTIKNIDFCSPSNKIKVGGSEADKRIENAEDDKVQAFANHLQKHHVIVNIRRSRGKDIDAACGQLANKQ